MRITTLVTLGFLASCGNIDDATDELEQDETVAFDESATAAGYQVRIFDGSAYGDHQVWFRTSRGGGVRAYEAPCLTVDCLKTAIANKTATRVKTYRPGRPTFGNITFESTTNKPAAKQKLNRPGEGQRDWLHVSLVGPDRPDGPARRDITIIISKHDDDTAAQPTQFWEIMGNGTLNPLFSGVTYSDSSCQIPEDCAASQTPIAGCYGSWSCINQLCGFTCEGTLIF